MNRPTTVLLATLAVLSATGVWAQSPVPEARLQFTHALRLAEAGSTTDAQALFESAARSFESAAADKSEYWYEAGNARWWQGRYDLAILDFRRDLARHPWDTSAWQNLAQARLKAGTQEPGGEGLGTVPWFLFLAMAAALSVGLTAAASGAKLLWRTSPFHRWAWGLLAAAAVLGGASALDFGLRRPLAVVVQAVQGRQGDAAVYAAQPAAPWKPGQEGWVAGTRDTWTELEIGGTLSWVPTNTLARPDS